MKDGALIYALGGLKNVGVEAMASLVRAREAGGAFTDIFDLMRRIDPKQVNKRTFETLICAGALDRLEPNRRKLFENAETLLAYAQAEAADRADSQASLLADAGPAPKPRLKNVADWPAMERLAKEHGAIGFYLTGHPLDDYAAALKRKRVLTYAAIESTAGLRPLSTRVAGVVTGRQERKSQRGNMFAFVQLSDPSAMFEVAVFSETLNEARPLLEAGTAVVLAVEATKQDDQLRLRVNGVQTVDDVVADAPPSGLRIAVRDASGVAEIQEILAPCAVGKRGGPATLSIITAEAEVELQLPGAYAVPPAAVGALRAAAGVADVEEM